MRYLRAILAILKHSRSFGLPSTQEDVSAAYAWLLTICGLPVGGQVRLARERSGLSQEELAGQAHIRQETLSRLERDYEVKLDSLYAVSTALDIPVVIFPGTAAARSYTSPGDKARRNRSRIATALRAVSSDERSKKRVAD